MPKKKANEISPIFLFPLICFNLPKPMILLTFIALSSLYDTFFASKFPCVAYASPTTGFAVARPENLSPIPPASLLTNSYQPNIFPSPICTTIFNSHPSSSPIKSHLPRGLSPLRVGYPTQLQNSFPALRKLRCKRNRRDNYAAPDSHALVV